MKLTLERRVVLVAIAVTAAGSACARSTEPHPSTQPASADANAAVSGDTLRIPLGGQAAAHDGAVVVTFQQRVGDSRCPANAVCVWAGDAEVRLRVRTGGTDVVTPLHTTLEPKAVTVGGYTLRLVSLTPYPGSGDPKETPLAYVVVTRGR